MQPKSVEFLYCSKNLYHRQTTMFAISYKSTVNLEFKRLTWSEISTVWDILLRFWLRANTTTTLIVLITLDTLTCFIIFKNLHSMAATDKMTSLSRNSCFSTENLPIKGLNKDIFRPKWFCKQPGWHFLKNSLNNVYKLAKWFAQADTAWTCFYHTILWIRCGT